MIRVVLFHLLMFLLPFIAYAAFLYMTKRVDVTKGENWQGAPVATLALSGMGAMALSFVLLAAFTGSSPDGTYQPARFENGVLVPGRIE